MLNLEFKILLEKTTKETRTRQRKKKTTRDIKRKKKRGTNPKKRKLNTRY